MARKIEYAVQSDLSGVEIPKGTRCVIRFEFDKEGEPNFTADLTAEEGTALIEHCHARKVTPRNRKPKETEGEAAEGTEENVSQEAAEGSEEAEKETEKPGPAPAKTGSRAKAAA